MENQYCTLYIARHGRTEWNEKGLIQGHKESALTPLGEEQARNLAQELRHIHFDAIFASDLLRAKRTAEIVALERKLVVETIHVLRERTYGKYEGKPYAAMRAFDEYYDTLSDELKFSHKTEGVESDEEMVTRFITFIREVAVIYAKKTFLIISHGDVMHKFLIHIGWGTYSNFPINSIENTAYIKLLSDGVDFFVQETKRIKVPSGK